jgi:hypothetical protein
MDVGVELGSRPHELEPAAEQVPQVPQLGRIDVATGSVPLWVSLAIFSESILSFLVLPW